MTLGNISANWSVVGAADFDNGKGDILWRDGGGNVAAWFMNGAALASVVTGRDNAPVCWVLKPLTAPAFPATLTITPQH